MPVFGLSRYPQASLDRLAACAALSERIGQLAITHPLLFYALATGYGPAAARHEAVRLAELGRPLREVCAAVSLPYAFRRVPAEAVAEPLVPAVFSERTAELVVQRVMRHDQREQRSNALRSAFYGTRVCDAAFGAWLADPRQARWLPWRLSELRALAVYVWCSRRPGLVPDAINLRPWSARMGWESTVRAARRWIALLQFHLCFTECPIVDAWGTRRELGGFEIVPLVTFEELIDEVTAMRNCLDTYARRLATGRCRLFGVRRRGAHVGTFEVQRWPSGERRMAQFRGPGNSKPPFEAVRATLGWVGRETFADDGPVDRGRHFDAARTRLAKLAAAHCEACNVSRDFWGEDPLLEDLSASLRRLHRMTGRTVRLHRIAAIEEWFATRTPEH